MRTLGLWLMLLLMVIFGRPENQVVDDDEESTVSEYDLPHIGIRHLDLNGRNIAIVKKVLQRYLALMDLWTLSFANNCIFHIDEKLFHPLVSLQKLDLHSNLIEKFHPNTFEFNQKLIELDISYNRFQVISIAALSPLMSLQVLNICGNPLTHIWTLANFTSKPTSFLETLTTLFVCNTTIAIIQPSEIGILRRLERLDISNNRNLMCEATFFETMKILEQDNVQLIEVKFNESATIHSFDTYGNATDYDVNVDRFVPITYGKPEDLLTKVCTNRVVLETTQQLLRWLNGIDLSNRQIVSISCEVFDDLHQLYYLDLSWNLLKRLASNCFEDLLELEVLNLSQNFLETIEAGTFKNNVRLRNLDLSRNKLTVLKKEVFAPLKSLEVLQLDENKLTHIWTIPGEHFLDHLINLSITKNQILSLRVDDFEMLDVLESIKISNNPLHCDDNFLEFIQFCLDENIELDVGFDYCMKTSFVDMATTLEQDSIMAVVQNGAASNTQDFTLIIIFIFLMILFIIFKVYC